MYVYFYEPAVFDAVELLIGGRIAQTAAGLDVGPQLDVVEIGSINTGCEEFAP